MTLVLDTSVLIDLEKGSKDVIARIKELSKTHNGPAVIAFINYFEFLFGIRERNPKNKEKALSFINKFGVLKVNKETAQILSDLKYKYDKKGETLPLADFLIASQVIENNMLLVTADKDFDKIEELRKIAITE